MLDAPRIRKPEYLPRPFSAEERDRVLALDLEADERMIREPVTHAENQRRATERRRRILSPDSAPAPHGDPEASQKCAE